MKYPYHIEYRAYGSPLMLLPKEVELVGLFLSCEVEDPMGGDSRLEEIDEVLQGEVAIYEVGGNAFDLEIREDLTTVIYLSPPDGGTQECLIETEELRHLIEIWLALKQSIYCAKRFGNAAVQECYLDPQLAVGMLSDQQIQELNMKHPVKVKKKPRRHCEPAVQKVSTFFPKHWSPQEVIDAINEAYYAKKHITGTRNVYCGVTSKGMPIDIYIDPPTGKISTAFPIYQPSFEQLEPMIASEWKPTKYPYHLEHVEVGPHKLPVMHLPEGMELVSTFLFTDVQTVYDCNFFVGQINRVLDGELLSAGAGGNLCHIKIRKNTTTIIEMIAEEDDPKGKYQIETEELKSLILTWTDLIKPKPKLVKAN